MGDPGGDIAVYAILIGVHLMLCWAVGSAAKDRGCSFSTFFWLSFIFTFMAGALILLIAGKDKQKAGLESGELRKCPFCAELVKSEAKLCRYCRSELP